MGLRFYVVSLLLILMMMYAPIFPFGFWINPPTGSMRPAIEGCDITIYGPGEPQVGDVMMYWYSDSIMLMHRVVEQDTESGETVYTFKGDNLDSPDSKPVTDDMIHAEVYANINLPVEREKCRSLMREPYNLFYDVVGVDRTMEDFSTSS